MIKNHSGYVAFLSFPKDMQEKDAFTADQSRIWNRMAEKDSKVNKANRFKNRPKIKDEKPLVFESFADVGQFLAKDNNWISKLYIHVHGDPSGLKMPDGKILEAKDFAGKLLGEGGIKARLTGKTLPNDCNELKIRSMACQTGRQAEEHGGKWVDNNAVMSWSEELRKELTAVVRAISTEQGRANTAQPNILVKGPIGWQFTWHDGRNVVYHTTDEKLETELDKTTIPNLLKNRLIWDHADIPHALSGIVISREKAYTSAICEFFPGNSGRRTSVSVGDSEHEKNDFIKPNADSPPRPKLRSQSFSGIDTARGQRPPALQTNMLGMRRMNGIKSAGSSFKSLEMKAASANGHKINSPKFPLPLIPNENLATKSASGGVRKMKKISKNK